MSDNNEDDNANEIALLGQLAEDMNLSCISIILREDDDEPELMVSGCNDFEAHGQLLWAVRQIEQRLDEPDEEDDEDEDYDL